MVIDFATMRVFLFAVLTMTGGAWGQGWTTLFDGKTLNGWEARATSAPPSTGDWKVEEATLVCGGGSPGWIATKATFGDFRLELEFRGAATVNSGVFLRSGKEGQPHVTGYELQIWERNFYPNIQAVANDLYKKGLLETGDYWIDIDW